MGGAGEAAFVAGALPDGAAAREVGRSAGARMPLAEWVQRWIDTIDVETRTGENHRRCLRLHILPAGVARPGSLAGMDGNTLQYVIHRKVRQARQDLRNLLLASKSLVLPGTG